MNIGLKVFYSFLHNKDRVKEKKEHILKKLNERGIGRFSYKEGEKEYDIHANIILTGGTEKEFLKTLDSISEPIIIFFDSTDNSLAATLELKTKLEDMGKKSAILSVDDPPEKIEETLKAVYTKKSIKDTKIGSIGILSPWLVASIPDRDSVREKFGIEIIDVELQELYDEVRKVDKEEITEIKKEFVDGAEEIVEPKESDIVGAIKIYVALKKIVGRYQLSSLTLSCFTILDVLKNTGCFALSKLNDEGIIAGCEGDLASTITMFILYKLTGKTPFMANPSAINIKENTITLAHCTVGRKLLKKYTVRSHFESGIGVAIQGDIESETVTLFRMGGKNMEKYTLFTGSKLPSIHSENLCRTQIKVKVNENLSMLFEKPAGNHLIIIEGKYPNIIKNFLNFV